MVLEIDGSILEGGGQILRLSVSLSSLCKLPINIRNIRANRTKPGLAPQHLTGLRLVNEICNGNLKNDFLRSTDIAFIPNVITNGKYTADTQTGGSIALLLQISLPCCLFAPGSVYLTLKGGTNADWAPSVDYMYNILKPNIQKFGANFDYYMIKRGFFRGNGIVNFTIKPVKQLQPVELLNFGQLESISGEAYVAGVLPLWIAEAMAQNAEQCLKKCLPDLERISVKPRKFNNSESFGNGSGINICAKTTTGCYLGTFLTGSREINPKETGKKAAEILLTSIRRKSCVDDNMQDQLIIFMALAAGKSRIKVGPLTQHTETAIYIAELITSAKFTIIKLDDDTNIIECDGIGLKNPAYA